MTPKDVRSIRISLAAGVDEFATLVGVDTATVMRWELGDDAPDAQQEETIQRLHANFNDTCTAVEQEVSLWRWPGGRSGKA